MTFKRPLSVSPIRQDIDTIQTQTNQTSVCLICGGKAQFINYGALSCASCKTFFRRNGFRANIIRQCNLDGRCNITIETRKVCTACRFAKCLAVGMSQDFIRKEVRPVENKLSTEFKDKQLIVSKSIPCLPTPTSLNLLSKDTSSLTASDWTLLSNVVHAFDTFSPLSDVRSIVQQTTTQSSLQQSLNLMSSIYLSLEAFVRSIADFRIMTTAEQCSLIQRNMNGLLAVCAVFIFRESGIFHTVDHEKAILPLYESNHVQCTKRITTQLDYDLTLIKLMLVTITFSSNAFTIFDVGNLSQDSLLYGTYRLFGSQNVYVELVWNYMLYRYGFQESVLRFSALIKIILDSLKLSSDVFESNVNHQSFANGNTGQTERTLTISGIENIPLWGKT